MTKVFTFDEAGMKKVAEAVTRLHAQTEHVRGELGRVQRSAAGAPQQSMKPQIRTGITGATPDITEYPDNAEGCLFPFHVYDLDFDVADIDSDCVVTDNRQWPQIYHIGRTIDGSYIPEGTAIVFAEIPNATGKQFWILQVGSPEAHPGPRWFIMREDLRPYEKNKKADFATYDPGTDTWLDGGDLGGTQELHDDGGQACVLVDELIFAFPRPFDAANNPGLNQWDIVYNHGLQRKGKINGGDVECGDFGNLEVWRDSTLIDCAGEKHTPEFLLPFCNTGLGYHRKLYGPADGTSFAPQDEIWLGFDGYHWFPVRDTKSHIARAGATASFCQDSNVSVVEIRYMDWQPTCVAEDANIKGVDNSRYRLAGSVGDEMQLVWDEEATGQTAAWVVIQVEHQSVEPITEIVDKGQGDCPSLELRKERIITMTSDACPVPDVKTFLEFETAIVTAQVRYSPSNCSFYETQRSICVVAGGEIFAEFQLNLGSVVQVMSDLQKLDQGGPNQTTDCALQATVVEICSLNQPFTPPVQNQPLPILFTEVDVIEDVFEKLDPPGLYQDKASHWVLCNNPPVEELIVEFTECEDEGGNEDIDP